MHSIARAFRTIAAIVIVIVCGVAGRVDADDVRVMTSGAFTAALLDLKTEFERTTPHKIVVVTTTMGTGETSIENRLKRGEPGDVVIVNAEALDDFIKQGTVVAGSRVDVARSAFGMAVRAGAPVPDVSTVDAFKRALLAAKSIAYSASVSGTYLSTELFQRLGIADRVLPKSRRIEGERVGAVVARGDAEVGFQQISELMPVPGITLTGPLPDGVQRVTVFSAGIAAKAPSPAAAKQLVDYLVSPAAAAFVRKSGMEPLAAAAAALTAKNVPEIQFDSVADFLKLPAGMNFGEVSGVAVNSKGHVFVFTRSNSAGGPAYAPTAAQLLEFGPKGEFVKEIGKGLYGWSFAHTVRVDKDDNVWAVDKGSDLVIKFNPAGRVVWVFGRRSESADDEAKAWEHPDPPLPAIDGRFRQPTDVAWDAGGNIYISDGYVNSRVAKYDRNGDWVKSWGDKGTAPGQFRLPHAIAVDKDDNIYVGDRSNRRIQVFDTEGNFLRMFTIDVPPPAGTKPVNGNTPTGAALAATIGAPNSICITPPPNQVMFVGESTYPGRLFKVSLAGEVLGVIGRSGRNLKQFSGAHQLACPSEREIYVAETSNWRVQKLILK
jgi:ABC-type molybdate transport system substrate-binding protein/sugar lactone lactonase YvrE